METCGLCAKLRDLMNKVYNQGHIQDSYSLQKLLCIAQNSHSLGTLAFCRADMKTCGLAQPFLYNILRGYLDDPSSVCHTANLRVGVF